MPRKPSSPLPRSIGASLSDNVDNFAIIVKKYINTEKATVSSAKKTKSIIDEQSSTTTTQKSSLKERKARTVEQTPIKLIRKDEDDGEIFLMVKPRVLQEIYGTGQERALFFTVLDNAPDSVWRMSSFQLVDYINKKIGQAPDARRLKLVAEDYKRHFKNAEPLLV